MGLGSPPVAGTMKMWEWKSSLSREKAMRAPSGEKAGVREWPRWGVRSRGGAAGSREGVGRRKKKPRAEAAKMARAATQSQRGFWRAGAGGAEVSSNGRNWGR